MKTQYEIRNPKTDGIFISFDSEAHAMDWWREYVKNAPPTGLHYGAVIVRHTWETHAEAETARLDFMISNGSTAKFSAACLTLEDKYLKNADEWPRFARIAIDRARNARPPTVDLIWPNNANELRPAKNEE